MLPNAAVEIWDFSCLRHIILCKDAFNFCDPEGSLHSSYIIQVTQSKLRYTHDFSY